MKWNGDRIEILFFFLFLTPLQHLNRWIRLKTNCQSIAEHMPVWRGKAEIQTHMLACVNLPHLSHSLSTTTGLRRPNYAVFERNSKQNESALGPRLKKLLVVHGCIFAERQYQLFMTPCLMLRALEEWQAISHTAISHWGAGCRMENKLCLRCDWTQNWTVWQVCHLSKSASR